MLIGHLAPLQESAAALAELDVLSNLAERALNLDLNRPRFVDWLTSTLQDFDELIVIYFTAPHRVDFRALVSDLARALRARIDLRQIGSGNIGATNVLRTGNKPAALATLLLDSGKGAIAVMIARHFGGDMAAVLAGGAAFLGHCFPVWLGFKGGKGVATFLGTLIALHWPLGLIACAIWLLTAAVSRISSLSALLAAALSPVFAWGLGRGDLIAVSLFMAVLIFVPGWLTGLLPGIPEFLFIAFQMTFAIITPALIVGAFAERMKFSAMLVFMGVWFTLVYAPIAHMVWGGDGGLMWDWGVLDFAGGTVVHINAGVAGLVACLVLGKRKGFPTTPMAPHNLGLTLVGAAMLWIGWFGFNAGSAVAANGTAGMAMLVTQIATAAAALGWMFAEWIGHGKPSALGIASGVVAGLVAITPAAGTVGPMGALIIGLVSGVVCFFCATSLKRKLGYDDSLDAFGVHGVGGIVGAVLTGALAVLLALITNGMWNAVFMLLVVLLVQCSNALACRTSWRSPSAPTTRSTWSRRPWLP